MPQSVSVLFSAPRMPKSTDELPAKWRQRGRFGDEHGDALRQRVFLGVELIVFARRFASNFASLCGMSTKLPSCLTSDARP